LEKFESENFIYTKKDADCKQRIEKKGSIEKKKRKERREVLKV